VDTVAPGFLVTAPARRRAHVGTAPLLRELRELGGVAAPLVSANLTQIWLGVVEAAVVGRLGARELGALGLGSTLFYTIAVPAAGLLLGFEPLIAQAIGGGDAARARRLVRAALAVSALASLPLALLGLVVAVRLERLGIPGGTAALARGYLLVRLLGLWPYLAFVAARVHAQATGRAPAVLRATAAAALLHLPLTILLVLGDGALPAAGIPLRAPALPALGLVGAAAASSLASAVAVLLLVAAPGCGPVQPRGAPRLEPPWRALGLGAPVALGMLAEQGVFTLVTVLVGGLAASVLAAHQIAMTYAGGAFMVPLAIGAAAAVRAGNAVGRGDAAGVRRAGQAAVAGVAVVMAVVAVLVLSAPRALAAPFTDDAAVLGAVAPLLRVAAVFILVDGVQATLAGALRGAGDTRFAALTIIGGHYGVGLPLGVLLAWPLGFGVEGLWWGLTIGLSVVAAALGRRFTMLTRVAAVTARAPPSMGGARDWRARPRGRGSRPSPAPAQGHRVRPARATVLARAGRSRP